MSKISSFKSIENKHVTCRGKDYMKRFYKSLREHAMEIINFKKKKMRLLIKEQQKSYETAKNCYICKERFENKLKIKKYLKVRNHCHYPWENRGAVHSMYNLKYNVPKNVPIAFHNGSNCDYLFFIKELVKEFEIQFTCLGENTKKYITLQFQ